MPFDRDMRHLLFQEGHADDDGVGANRGQEAVVVAAAVAEAVEVQVEGDHRHDNDIDVIGGYEGEPIKGRAVGGMGPQGPFYKRDAAGLMVLWKDLTERHFLGDAFSGLPAVGRCPFCRAVRKHAFR